VSAVISKAMYIRHLPASFCEMACVRLELQPAKSVGSSVRIVCGVGAWPPVFSVGSSVRVLERGGGAVGASKVLKYLEVL
jgi:hypothetical protein